MPLKNEIKDAVLEALYEYEEYRKRQDKRNKFDKISKNQAYKIIPRGKVEALIATGRLEIEKSGIGKTSTIYVSRKKLLALKDLII